MRTDDMTTRSHSKAGVTRSTERTLLRSVELDVDWPFYANSTQISHDVNGSLPVEGRACRRVSR